jgi:hypothetical protein
MRHELTDHEWAVIKPILPNTFVVAEIERFDYFVHRSCKTGEQHPTRPGFRLASQTVSDAASRRDLEPLAVQHLPMQCSARFSEHGEPGGPQGRLWPALRASLRGCIGTSKTPSSR